MSGSQAGASSTAEHLKVVSAKFGTCLHPSRAANVKLGVAETLNSLLFKYNEEFDGVVLAYLHPKLVGRTGKVLDGLYPYFHVDVAAKLLLFCPKSGMKLDGKVNKLGKDHLGVLVLNIFNASIAVADIRDDLQYQGPEDDSVPHSQRAWRSRTDRRHVIRLGSTITFTVKSVQEAEQFIDITGSLQSENTGCSLWLACRPKPQKLISDVATPSGVKQDGQSTHKPHLAVTSLDLKKRSREGEVDDNAVHKNHKFKRKKH